MGSTLPKKCYDSYDYRKEISLKADVSSVSPAFSEKFVRKFAGRRPQHSPCGRVNGRNVSFHVSLIYGDQFSMSTQLIYQFLHLALDGFVTDFNFTWCKVEDSCQEFRILIRRYMVRDSKG